MTSARRCSACPDRPRNRRVNRTERRDPTMLENRNTILAVILSGLVLIAWQYFYNIPQMEKQRAQQQAQAELQKQSAPAQQPTSGASPSTALQLGS